jgi:hypothetical protein
MITRPNRYHSGSLYSLNCTIAIDHRDIHLAAKDESELSFDFDLERNIMAFDWQKVLIEIFREDREVRRKVSGERCTRDQHSSAT